MLELQILTLSVPRKLQMQQINKVFLLQGTGNLVWEVKMVSCKSYLICICGESGDCIIVPCQNMI